MKRLALALCMLCFPLVAHTQPAPFATTKLADNVSFSATVFTSRCSW